MELSPVSCFSIQVLMRSRPSFLTCATALNSTVAKSVVSGFHAARSLADSIKCLSSDKKVGSKCLKFLAKTLRILICVNIGNAAFFCVIKWYSRCFRKSPWLHIFDFRDRNNTNSCSGHKESILKTRKSPN